MSRQRSMREEKLMSMLLSNKILQILLAVVCISSVLLFYNFAGTRESIFESKKSPSVESERPFDPKFVDPASKHAEEYENDYHIMFMFTNVFQHPELRTKLDALLNSLFQHIHFGPNEILHLHFVCDESSKLVAEEKVESHKSHPKVHVQGHFHDMESVAKQVHPIVKKMQEQFGNHAYYKDSIFFLSIAMHRILPSNIHRIVQLDLDLKIEANIKDLWDKFHYFKHTNLFGLAHENQPVYRHTFWKYRKDNPGTKVGGPPPDGITGFNSGVILLDLDAIRESRVYNSVIDSNKVTELAEKYHFKGHLGDQDFFTLLSIEHPELFYILECVWNRQLCQWWRNHGYQDIFDRYFACTGPVKIWHGNCNTPFPDTVQKV